MFGCVDPPSSPAPGLVNSTLYRSVQGLQESYYNTFQFLILLIDIISYYIHPLFQDFTKEYFNTYFPSLWIKTLLMIAMFRDFLLTLILMFHSLLVVIFDVDEIVLLAYVGSYRFAVRFCLFVYGRWVSKM